MPSLEYMAALVTETADELGALERQAAEDYLLHVAGGQNSWTAQKMTEVTFATRLRRAQADYELALADYRRCNPS